MILQTCPYTNKSNADAGIRSLLGRANLAAVHTATKDFIPSHTGPLSIKFVLRGTEMYNCENLKLSVDRYKYLIINKDQHYTSAIDSPEATISFCVFFSDKFISDAHRFASESGEGLLDNALDYPYHTMHFHQKLYWKNDTMNNFIGAFGQIARSNPPHDTLRMNELYADLLQVLMATHRSEKMKWNGIKALKKSTRQELYRRISRSGDFIHENFHTSLSIEELAEIACLSSFHFIRAFKQVFRLSPYQYMTVIRLQHARRLLKHTSLTIKEIGSDCGYDDESSFIRLFKEHVGLTPAVLRKQLFEVDHPSFGVCNLRIKKT